MAHRSAKGPKMKTILSFLLAASALMVSQGIQAMCSINAEIPCHPGSGASSRLLYDCSFATPTPLSVEIYVRSLPGRPQFIGVVTGQNRDGSRQVNFTQDPQLQVSSFTGQGFQLQIGSTINNLGRYVSFVSLQSPFGAALSATGTCSVTGQ